MIEIKPFRALRFDTPRIDLNKVACPPYDVISDSARDELYRKSTDNFVRVEYPRPERDDLSGDEKYARAKTALAELISKAALVQDEKESFYLYEQILRVPESRSKYSRLGIFCLMKLDELENGNVLPHEKTHRTAKDDRFKLLKETQANTSPIMGLYEDDSCLVNDIFDNDEGEAVAEFIDAHGDRHRLLRLSDETRIKELEKMFADKKIVIADGHHRYETALNYKKHVERLDQKRPEDDYVMMCLIEWDEPGLVILPIHRLVRSYGKMSRVEFLVRLKRDFILKEISLQQVPQVVKELERDFIVYLGGNYAYHTMIKDPDHLKVNMEEGKPEIWYDLTVTWFKHFICDGILDLDEREFEKNIGYKASYKDALTEVTAGTARAAFLFSATQKEEMKEIVDAGELMPQKSTFFYPKLFTGLTIYPHFDVSSYTAAGRPQRGRDASRRGGRHIDVVSTVAAQVKAEEAQKKVAKQAAEEKVAEAKAAAEAASEEVKPEGAEAAQEVPQTETAPSTNDESRTTDGEKKEKAPVDKPVKKEEDAKSDEKKEEPASENSSKESEPSVSKTSGQES